VNNLLRCTPYERMAASQTERNPNIFLIMRSLEGSLLEPSGLGYTPPAAFSFFFPDKKTIPLSGPSGGLMQARFFSSQRLWGVYVFVRPATPFLLSHDFPSDIAPFCRHSPAGRFFSPIKNLRFLVQVNTLSRFGLEPSSLTSLFFLFCYAARYDLSPIRR